MRIVAATANPGKVAEIVAILGGDGFGLDVELLPRPDSVVDVVEDAPDLIGNARLKATAVSLATGMLALADDTGLEVDALEGLPGVRSARFAGDQCDEVANVAKLLADLNTAGAVEPEDRRARFRTVVLLVGPDGAETVAEGTVEGFIAQVGRGEGGFGYDPVFIPDDGDGRTFAEMSTDEKNGISHRGRALRDLAAQLSAHLK